MSDQPTPPRILTPADVQAKRARLRLAAAFRAFDRALADARRKR